LNNKNLNRNFSKLPKITGYDILVFILWPFAILIYRLKTIKDPISKTVFWLFCVFFGFTFILQEDIEGAADSARYVTYLEHVYNNNITGKELFNDLYNTKSADVKFDIYQVIITWFVSIFTDNGKVLFTIFSAIFGYFYVQNLWIIFSKLNKTKGLIIGIFITFFILIIPIWQVNGVRMWTAAHVYLYGILLHFLNNKNKSGLFWVLVSSLFHFSFLLPGFIFILFRFYKPNVKILMILFLISFSITEIDLGLIKNNSFLELSIFEEKANDYTNEDYVEIVKEKQEEKSLNFKVFSFFISFFTLFWIIILYLMRKIISNYLGKDFLKFFEYLLFFGIFSQLVSSVPSGGRFLSIFYFLLYGLVLILISHSFFIGKYYRLLKLTTPFFIYFILFKVRIGMEFFGPFLIFGNPIISILFSDEKPMITFIKDIFI
jgi:hypothetical protein